MTPDKEKARSILRMAETTLEMIDSVDSGRFPSNVLKEYSEVMRELISVILLLDGYKTVGEGAHKRLIDYLEENYKEFEGHEISLLNDMRIARNKIAYNGFFITEDYLEREGKDIHVILEKLTGLIEEKL